MFAALVASKVLFVPYLFCVAGSKDCLFKDSKAVTSKGGTGTHRAGNSLAVCRPELFFNQIYSTMAWNSVFQQGTHHTEGAGAGNIENTTYTVYDGNGNVVTTQATLQDIGPTGRYSGMKAVVNS